MFRSRTRPVVYSQAEHARLAAAVAAVWGNETVPRPPLPFESFVRGVELHDRGYGELDTDGIGETSDARWLEIQRRGFAAQDPDPVVDLVVAMHVHRLVSGMAHVEVARAFEGELAGRRLRAGVSQADAEAADRVTNLCDRLSFAFCFEQDEEGSVAGLAYAVAADGSAHVDPWPLGVPELRREVAGYAAGGYPERLEPETRTFVLRPR
jgi:hypothetical protein